MAVDSVSGNVASISIQSKNRAVSLEQPLVGNTTSKDQPFNQTPAMSTTISTNTANKVSPVISQSQNVAKVNPRKIDRAIRNVVEVYNQQGKVRTKFMDSHNNVIYQIPSEMVAKMEDLMMNQGTSANIKG